MRTQAEIERDREADQALVRAWDEALKHMDWVCAAHAYLRGYYDGIQGKVVTLPGRERDAE